MPNRDKQQVSVWLTPDQHLLLKKKAAEQNRSMAGHAAHLVLAGLEDK